jgi:predicted Zn-dependent protease
MVTYSLQRLLRLTLTTVLFLSCASLPAGAQNKVDLPSMGERGVVPVGQEYNMGRVWLMSFRRQAPVVEDPLLQVYVEDLVYRLAETSELKDHRLTIVVVNNSSINAFAVPGGVVGVHNGLIEKAGTEAQLASVLTHELAHLSQRHFSRSVEAKEASKIPSMIGLLGGMVAIAAGSGEAGVGAILGSQAAAQNSQLRFSRGHEQEADRFGIQNLQRAGFDPSGAAEMFTVMQAQGRRYGSRPPEFLMSHPVTESRIADGRNRARQYPRRMYADNPEFQLMRTRVKLSFMKDNQKAVDHFREELAKKGRNAESQQYALVLALTLQRQYAEAMKYLQPLREFSPDSLPYLLAEADVYIESGEFDDALSLLGRKWTLMPGNHPITMAMVKAHLRAGRYTEAEQILAPHARRRSSDPYVWYVLAEIQGLSGNNYALHQSRAQYFYLNGRMLEARAQLGYALRLAPDNVAKQRIRTEQRQVEGAARALGQM